LVCESSKDAAQLFGGMVVAEAVTPATDPEAVLAAPAVVGEEVPVEAAADMDAFIVGIPCTAHSNLSS
jgi:hypothetical protein